MNEYNKRRAYLCDPSKHTKCKKTLCHINGGECRKTFHKEFAKEVTHEDKTNRFWV